MDRRPNASAISMRLWFAALVAISAALLVITIFSYSIADQRSLTRVLFWFGLGGEANIGAWWSGMLLALAAIMTFDGFFDQSKPPAEQRGWLALGCALLLLSFDEIASIHEYLSGLGFRYLAVLGVVGLTVASYGVQQLHQARVPARTLALLLLAFGLLASVAIQEWLQHALQWNDRLIYGFRAFLEEGTEIVAMLIFVSVGRATSMSLLRGSGNFLVALVHFRRIFALNALLLWPLLVAATFALPRPGGPPAWLGSTLLLACALLVARARMLRDDIDSRSLVLILFYLAASAAANAVPFRWVAVMFDVPVGLRGIVFALLVASAVAVLRANGRRLKAPRTLAVAAIMGASAIEWPSSQLLWCGLPPAFALWLYVIESRAAAEDETARATARALDPVTAPTSG